MVALVVVALDLLVVETVQQMLQPIRVAAVAELLPDVTAMEEAVDRALS